MSRAKIGNVAARWWPIGAAVLVVAVAAGVVVATAREETLRAQVGDVVTADIGDDAADEDTIRLPGGEYDVAVSKAVAGDDVGDLDGRSAPDGGSWVALRVATTPTKYYSLPATVSRRDSVQPKISVALVAGERTYPVPSDPLNDTSVGTATPGRGAWVAVAGKPTDLAVAVTYDGVRQTVRPADGKRDAGRAAPLYTPAFAGKRLLGDTPSTCSAPRYSASFGPSRERNPLRCGVSRYPALPYLPTLGWAPSGSQWLALYVQLPSFATFRWQGSGDQEAFYASYRSPVVSVSVDGTRAVDGAAAAPTLRIGTGGALAVFRVPGTADRHQVSLATVWADLDTDARRLPAGAPQAPDITVSWTGEVR